MPHTNKSRSKSPSPLVEATEVVLAPKYGFGSSSSKAALKAYDKRKGNSKVKEPSPIEAMHPPVKAERYQPPAVPLVVISKAPRSISTRIRHKISKLFGTRKSKLPMANISPETAGILHHVDTEKYGVEVEQMKMMATILSMHKEGEITNKEKWNLIGTLKKNAKILEPIREHWPKKYVGNLLNADHERVKEIVAHYRQHPTIIERITPIKAGSAKNKTRKIKRQ